MKTLILKTLLIGIGMLSLVIGQETEVSVPDTNGTEIVVLNLGDIAPSWALQELPTGKIKPKILHYEFLKTWTVGKDERLRKFTTQPDRHVVVLSFFATWCKPCMKELPHIQNLYEKYSDQKIKFFLIDITEATRTISGFEDYPKAGPFLTKKGIDVPVLNDNRGVAKERYGVETLPRLFVIDKYQTIQLIKQGFNEDEDFEKELSDTIDKLLK
ncbi:MAG: TlpA family protein disulfide reductase [Candidatus Marinimicrobia bacterium]|nr:TlpA family protein disulfide reductase [Candidatus Neomarinimicrobiota bacterium]